ncbi:MAG TPA: tetratricopeptide repeat protein, partial [Stellaceae bacterium]|nr:tetratricopeptide repeat protein [Stellaceae bacterium]
MNSGHRSPLSAIDETNFAGALEAGALDPCLEYLRANETISTEAAWLACRLGERLFYEGRDQEAVECGQLAFAAAANDNDVVHFCAWLFSNCGCYDAAAAAYERLLEQRPDWIEGYRHASGALAVIGERERAIDLALTATALAPTNFDFAYHAGCLMLEAARRAEAAHYLTCAVALDPHHPHALRALSACYAVDRPADALSLALEAATLAPDDSELAIHAAELLLRGGRFEEAVTLLETAVARDPWHPTLWRLLSTVESQRDRVANAIAAIDRALQLAPKNAEYHLHRGHLLYRTGDFAEAAEAINRAAEFEPSSHAVSRARLDL